MADPMGRAWLENQAIGHHYIEFKNWPTSYDNFNLAIVKYEWWILKQKYHKMIKLGEEVVKILNKQKRR